MEKNDSPARHAIVSKLTVVLWRPRTAVADVAAVGLADGKQVERGREHAEPRCECNRMHAHGVAIGHRPERQPRCGFEQQRFTQLEQRAVEVFRHLHDLGHVHPDHQSRDEDDESGQRSGDTDVEERSLGRESAAVSG